MHLIGLLCFLASPFILMLWFINLVKKNKTLKKEGETERYLQYVKKGKRLKLIGFALIGAFILFFLTPTDNENLKDKNTTKNVEKIEEDSETEKENNVEASVEPSTEEIATNELNDETSIEDNSDEISTEETIEESVGKNLTDDSSIEDVEQGLENMFNENIMDANLSNIMFQKDSLGTNLIVEMDAISSDPSKEEIKDILNQTFGIISQTDIEYDTVQVNVSDLDGYRTKVTLENDGIWSIRNNDNESTMKILQMFSKNELLIK